MGYGIVKNLDIIRKTLQKIIKKGVDLWCNIDYITIMDTDITSMEWVTENFACKGSSCCNHSAPYNIVLLHNLQCISDSIGLPINMTSGFRCKKHNITVSKHSDSYHTRGIAGDIWVEGMSGPELAQWAAKRDVFYNGGIGIYHNRIHVDHRPNGPARWFGSKIDEKQQDEIIKSLEEYR